MAHQGDDRVFEVCLRDGTLWRVKGELLKIDEDSVQIETIRDGYVFVAPTRSVKYARELLSQSAEADQERVFEIHFSGHAGHLDVVMVVGAKLRRVADDAVRVTGFVAGDERIIFVAPADVVRSICLPSQKLP